MNYQHLDTPIGRLRLVSSGSRLTAIEFEGATASRKRVPRRSIDARAHSQPVTTVLRRPAQTVRPALAPAGTAFQRSVWTALAAIPWGGLRSYADIACAIDRPTAVRAVEAANGRNPLPIVIPPIALSAATAP